MYDTINIYQQLMYIDVQYIYIFICRNLWWIMDLYGFVLLSFLCAGGRAALEGSMQTLSSPCGRLRVVEVVYVESMLAWIWLLSIGCVSNPWQLHRQLHILVRLSLKFHPEDGTWAGKCPEQV